MFGRPTSNVKAPLCGVGGVGALGAFGALALRLSPIRTTFKEHKPRGFEPLGKSGGTGRRAGSILETVQSLPEFL